MANVIHGVVRTDAMLATSASAGLFSFKYFGTDGTPPTSITAVWSSWTA